MAIEGDWRDTPDEMPMASTQVQPVQVQQQDWWSSNAPATSTSGASSPWTESWIRQQLSETGQDPNTWQYWAGKEAELKARGQELGDPNYALTRLRDPNSGNAGGGNRYGSLAMPGGGFGAAPAPYQSQAWSGGSYTTPTLPANLQSPLTLGRYALPTREDLYAMPGYQAGLDAVQQATQRAAAAKGTVLNPGTVAALQRRGLDYADQQYAQLAGLGLGAFNANTGAALGERQQNFGEYQAGVGNANTEFQNRYGQYLNENARTLNDYLTNYGIQHTADTDYWNRLKDVSGAGLSASLGDRAS